MPRYIIDASAAVEFVLQSELGVRLSTIMGTNRMFVPELLFVEVLAALRSLVLRNELSEEDARVAIAQLESWNVERLSHEGLSNLAWRYRQNVNMYDAIYLAAAKKHDLEVLTADSKLARAPGVDVVVHDVRDPHVVARLRKL